jgi:hypothetical protein
MYAFYIEHPKEKGIICKKTEMVNDKMVNNYYLCRWKESKE